MKHAEKITRKRSRTISKILNAATEVFAESGFNSANIEEIAKRANVDRASIYYYLCDKKEIYSRAIVGWAGGAPLIRLMEMGVMRGTEIEMVKLAPLGDPIEVKLRGYHLSLRKQEAEQIEISRAG